MDNDIQKKLEEIQNNLREIREEGLRRAKEKYQNVNERIQNQRDQMKDYVKNNPEKAVAISMVAGFLAGIILTMIAISKRR